MHGNVETFIMLYKNELVIGTFLYLSDISYGSLPYNYMKSIKLMLVTFPLTCWPCCTLS